MKNYTAVSLKADDVNFLAADDTDARHWIINHLDLSLGWSIFKTH